MSKTNSQVAHIWAQNNGGSGKTNNGNVFFEHGAIYSYGYHFPMAKFLDDKTVLINNDSYSPSTGQQQSEMRQALDYDKITRLYCSTELIKIVADSKLPHLIKSRLKIRQKELQADAISKARVYCMAAARRRAAYLKDSDYNAAFNILQNLVELLAFYKIKAHKPVFDIMSSILNDRDSLAEKFSADIERAAKKRRANDKKRLKDRQADIEQAAIDFKDNVPMNQIKITALYDNPLILMRIDGDNIKTSQGASFPVDHGKKAFTFIKDCKDNQREFLTNGKTINLGHFRIDRIETNGNVKAGCHYVEYAEIERVAALLGL
tara:strand:+ start:988 stop:1947 length:960 start_codon:yes stop_codon:yes gene_type:complete